jgi:two-component system, LytTR family, response regulator
VIGECRDGREAVTLLRREHPDLVFLDIQMPQMDGFEVLKQLEPRRFPVVIFVTAYDQYAVKAFEYHALDYLLKPFRRERFAEALQRARDRVGSSGRVGNFRRFRSLLEHWEVPSSLKSGTAVEVPTPHRQRIFVRTGKSSVSVEVAHIDWIKSVDHFVELHSRGKSHLVYASIGELENQLDPGSFVRIHRTTLVNLAAIKEFRTGDSGAVQVVLRDGSAHRVSRSRRRFLQANLSSNRRELP